MSVAIFELAGTPGLPDLRVGPWTSAPVLPSFAARAAADAGAGPPESLWRVELPRDLEASRAALAGGEHSVARTHAALDELPHRLERALARAHADAVRASPRRADGEQADGAELGTGPRSVAPDRRGPERSADAARSSARQERFDDERSRDATSDLARSDRLRARRSTGAGQGSGHADRFGDERSPGAGPSSGRELLVHAGRLHGAEPGSTRSDRPEGELSSHGARAAARNDLFDAEGSPGVGSGPAPTAGGLSVPGRSPESDLIAALRRAEAGLPGVDRMTAWSAGGPGVVPSHDEDGPGWIERTLDQIADLARGHARIETRLEGALVAHSLMTLSGDTELWIARRLSVAGAQLHARSVAVAVRTRHAWARILTLVARGCARIIALGLPGASLTALPMVWRFVRDVLREVRGWRAATRPA